ncbi:glutamate receptor 2.9-like isoform X2 [Vicia villosa]|uniref:glutamate receptor 2.9-like isoform X2 n=1 Tax=Vicia villosa TaxID=3911 RepID=UPI00273BF21E|nr:glutamate receptor 2.9-like isoform X2 [Vicia villosa]
MGRNSSLQLIICFNIVLYLLAWSRVQTSHSLVLQRTTIMSIGAVLDLTSLMGKQQKIAMDIAVEEFNIDQFSSFNIDLQIKDSHRNSAQVIASVMELSQSNQVQAIIGTITHNEATLASEFSGTINTIPIMSLTSFSARPELLSPRLPHFIQVGDDINLHMQCISAIVGEFGWKKVTVIYELNNDFSSDPGILLSLSYSLKLVGSEIDNHLAFPSLSTLSDPKTTIENELHKLKKKSNRVFLIVHSSLELANMLCEKAKQIGLMEKGSVWIIPNEVAGLLDSVNSSVIFNMQGVVGFKTHFIEKSEAFREFKFKFQRKFSLEYPEEDNINPSIFALQAYDATKAIAKAANKSSQGKFSLTEFSKMTFLSNKFERLSGKTFSKKNGQLLQSPTFNIINVIGKSYREMASWSPALGFSKHIVNHNKVMEIRANNDDSDGVFKTVYWPGELQSVPKGHNNEQRSLKIAIPSNGAFTQFVNVEYDQGNNEPKVTGFSVSVFKAAVKRLPYVLNYKFFPFNGSYDEMVDHVYNKTLDAAVGDTSIVAYRYHLVEFSQPYIESGLHMVVTEQPAKSKETWMFLAAFTKEMWLMMTAMHVFVGFVIWLIEREVNEDLRGFGSMLWFLVTVLFYAHREPIRRPLAQVVLTPWLFAIFIVTNSFTASLTSITISQVKPSVLDIQTLKERNSPIGCDGNSFIIKYLTEVLNFKPGNIRKINSMSDYPAAFDNKEIEAAFFVAPHAKVFLAKYSCKGFIKAGNTYRLGGFGFVFPKGSSLAADISEALLSMIESGETEQLEKEMLNGIENEGKANCSDLASKGKNNSSIGLPPYLGLFSICSTVTILGLSYYVICWLVKNVETLASHAVLTLTQLWRIWRWTTNIFARCCSKMQSRTMRRIGSCTETRNAEENVTDSQQIPVVVELVDTVLAAHAS